MCRILLVKKKLKSDAELQLSRQLLYKTSFEPKVLFWGQRAGNNFTPVEPASLLLEMLIENTSVIDGAGNGFSLVYQVSEFRHRE